jgi:agmatinase
VIIIQSSPLSLDIDVIDPGLAPASESKLLHPTTIVADNNTAGTPEAGGWTMRELKRIIRGLAGLNFM